MLRTYFEQNFYDMPVEIAQKYAERIRMAILTGKDFDGEKKKGFFLSKKRGFEDKLYVGNIHRIENHLYWNDEELADDDQIVNVVVIDGPVTRDGDGCSYGSKDHRDQIMYAVQRVPALTMSKPLPTVERKASLPWHGWMACAALPDSWLHRCATAQL